MINMITMVNIESETISYLSNQIFEESKIYSLLIKMGYKNN